MAGESCSIMAHTRNSKGEVVESNLFKDLLHYTQNNRGITKQYYAVGTNEDFLSKVRNEEEYKEDENGEITLKSLLHLAKLDLETDKLIEVLNKDIHSGKYSYEEALKKVQYFNENSKFADKTLATMVPTGNGQYFVSVVPVRKNVFDNKGRKKEETINSDEQHKLYNTVRNKEIEKRIIDLLKRYRVSTKFIENDTEGGRYSTENITNAENGLYALIEINNQGNVTEVMAEEAGHFAIGALGENALVRRLEDYLSGEETQKEVLGEEEFEKSNLGDNPAREIAGRLVGKALERRLSNSSTYKVLANRIANIAKRVFSKLTGHEVRWAAAKAEQVASKIAYQFVEGNENFSVQNALSIPEVMKHAERSLNVETYKKILNEMGGLCKKLESIRNNKISKQMAASLGQTMISASDTSGKTALQYEDEKATAMADGLAFDGIVQALVQITDYLTPGGQVDKYLDEVNVHNPSEFFTNLSRNGRHLRQTREIVDSAKIILGLVQNALDPNNLRTLVSSSGSTLEDAKYEDLEGTSHSVDVNRLLTGYSRLIDSKERELSTLEASYFSLFCQNVYGSKYINTTVGKLWKDIFNGNTDTNNEVEISIDDMVRGNGFCDIDIYHRFLASMANNPDAIGQIVDKLVKMSNKKADDLAIHYKEQLNILKNRAKKLGLNVEDLVERDENGIPTGNFITPPASATESGNTEEDYIFQKYLEDVGDDPSKVYAVNHGEWERRREEHKKKHWEIFKKNNPGWEKWSGLVRGLKWDEYYRPEYKKWNATNSLKVEGKTKEGYKFSRWVPNKVYKTDAWDKLNAKVESSKGKGNRDSLNAWMHDYMKIKEQLDDMLPPGATMHYRMPQFRGSFSNTIRNKANYYGKGKTKSFFETLGRRGILESFVETADDTDYGDMTTMNGANEELMGTPLEYEKERPLRLNTFGINKLKNMQDLSTDIFGSTLAYASMATSYSTLSEIVDALEIGRETLYRRDAEDQNSFATKAGLFIERPGRKRREVKERGSKNLAYSRYVKFLEKQVYGIGGSRVGIKLWGKRFLFNKMFSNISSLAGITFLKGNVLGGMVNTGTGTINVFKEAVVGEYYNINDWYWAHRYYWGSFGRMWVTDLGSKVKTNKLDLFIEQMNILGDNREKFRTWNTNRNRFNNFLRTFEWLPYSAGDHYMQSMSYLAVAHGTKLYDTHGREASNLWSAWKKQENTDEFSRYKKGVTLKFDKFCPISSSEITSSVLDSEGVYLKEVDKTKTNFHRWVCDQESSFLDEGYLSRHMNDYEDYKRQFNRMPKQELIDYRSNQYNLAKGVLDKVSSFLSSRSPLVSPTPPTFTLNEELYLNILGVGTGDYQGIVNAVQEDVYNMIWTKRDESNYMDKCREINDRLHGIYNQQDKTTMHQNLVTNAILAMKGWVLGYLEHMWSNNHTSIALGKNTEGFINTAAKLPVDYLVSKFITKAPHMSLWELAAVMILPHTAKAKRAMQKAGYTEAQSYNARRMVISLLIIGLLLGLKGITKLPDDESPNYEDDDAWKGLIYYFAYRLAIEQETFIEAFTTYRESNNIMSLMPAGVAAAFDLAQFGYECVGALVGDEEDSDFFYQNDDSAGKYEAGDSKAWQHFKRITPYVKSVWNWYHPYEAAKNYEFGRKMSSR